eukprot:6213024-Pleurochrysis_carterae.AAC.12
MDSHSTNDESCMTELVSECCCITAATPPYRIIHANAAWCRATGALPQDRVGPSIAALSVLLWGSVKRVPLTQKFSSKKPLGNIDGPMRQLISSILPDDARQMDPGPETCARTLQIMHEALVAMQPIAVRLINYRRVRSAKSQNV